RLAALEAVREAVQFVEIEQARRFTNRALPMAETESAVFDETLALWEEMNLGYLRCLQAVAADEPGMREEAATVCQRALAHTGRCRRANGARCTRAMRTPRNSAWPRTRSRTT